MNKYNKYMTDRIPYWQLHIGTFTNIVIKYLHIITGSSIEIRLTNWKLNI